MHHQPTSDPVAGSQGRAGSETVMDLVKRIDRLAAAMRAAGGYPERLRPPAEPGG